ncbi:NHL repeat containing protein [Thermodesulfatator indicus DSM 15286]|uniref:NHL repeat containing protein n=1 Tax=Thermodesulfatator indicus (strain DSM 15286 / JCM 11887 / CIR29812) TaxID=667014 RepID=F8AAD5_THEID|nr:NHL repeat-containing protein [Thermodesulfatator indicus]AEH44274.1 NHL repeat containing protein [Thermodesulfatator indicus DSM 15286]
MCRHLLITAKRVLNRWRYIFLFIFTLIVFWPTNCLSQSESDKSILPIFKYKLLFKIEGFKLPSDVDIGPEGWIYVLDGTQNLVRIFNALGQPLFTLGGDKLLKWPLGLAVSAKGEVLVADSQNHRLALFPPGINKPHYISVPSPKGGRPSDPTDVGFGIDGKTYIAVDNDNHRVLALDYKGKIVWATGEMGRGPEEFRYPFLMDTDEQGNIYVVEVINTRVQVLDKNGHFLRFIGEWGIDPGQFFRPKGVAVSKDGKVFVSDSYVGVIQIFTKQGNFLGAVGGPDGKLWRFQTPVGLAVNGKRLYVVEMIKNRVLVLEEVP